MKALILDLITLHISVKFWHWQLREGEPKHRALGNLYDSLNENIDTLVEIYQGNTEEVLMFDNTDITSYPASGCCDKMKEFSTKLTDTEKKLADKPHIQNIVCEIHEAIDKCRYLMSL